MRAARKNLANCSNNKRSKPRQSRRPSIRTCRVCGCTDAQACIDDAIGPCWWVDEDLCSHCEMGLDCDHAGQTERQLIRLMNGEG